MSVDIGVEFFAGLDDKVSQIHKRVHHRASPIFKPWGTSATGTAPLTVQISNEVPPGRIYNLLGVGLFGVDGHTVLAGALAEVYRASSGVDLPDFSAQIGLFGAIPDPQGMKWYSRQVIWIEPGESLVAIAYGFAGTQTVTMVAQVADYPIEAVEAQWT